MADVAEVRQPDLESTKFTPHRSRCLESRQVRSVRRDESA
jgi:hypothetical protein